MMLKGAEVTSGMAEGTHTQKEDPQSIRVRKARLIITPGDATWLSEEK